MTNILSQLQSYGQVLSSAPHRLAPLHASDPFSPMDELQRHYQDAGYLWLKQLLPRDEVFAFRHHFFSAMQDTGLLKPGSDPVDGLFSDEEQTQRSHKRLMELVRTAAYEAFCLHPNLYRFMDCFLGGMSYLHKRKIIRFTRPGEPNGTPAHYDLIYLRGGTDRVVTAWIPIGDIPAHMGGLVYLEGSDRVGRQMEADFSAMNAALSPEERISAYNRNMTKGGWVSKDLPDMAERFSSRWLYADYESGDVMLHSPYMIHAATANTDPCRLRLSTDIRYQNVSDEIDARWTQHWTLDDML
ncbi:dehydrogenase [Deinococcus psychrotolerans]|uniref:Dehydrogenase n=1 Tax=Deinococcus psychrotolerans TaxID=2489213 RepID=A0A3G8YS81_9DEIO|nr:phytanoyl-CoA dioxygenase family protein [Deinococcus psychrotolerans]AZI44066.1 dehydrogenase [Deinococcus psychrotolerans]